LIGQQGADVRIQVEKMLGAICRRMVSIVSASILLACELPAFADPPNFAQSPANAVWIVHADFDALRNSKVYQKIVAGAPHWKLLPRWKTVAEHLAKVNGQLGMDLAKDLHGMTLFGPRLSEHKAMLVMRADWDLQTFRHKLALAKDHSISTVGKYEVQHFTRTEGGKARSVSGACWKPGTFVFCRTSEEVLSGLELLDGRQPALASGSPLAADVPSGTILMARMIEVGDSQPVESPLLKQTEQIDVACGENSGDCFIRGKLLAKTTEAAQQGKKVADGFLALARLQAASDGEALKLLDRLQIGLDGRTLLLNFHIPAGELSVELEKAMEKYGQTK
jgi:hypothetical protein